MEMLRLVGFVLVIILVILAIFMMKLIGFEIHQKEMKQQLILMDERLCDIETKELFMDRKR